MHARTFIRAAAIASIGLACAPQTAAAARYTVYNLGTFGGTSSSGNTINNRGWAMGNANLPGDGSTHAAVWVDGLKFDLGTLGGPNSGVEWPVQNGRGIIAGISETAALDTLNENWSCSAFFPSIDHHVCVGFRFVEGAMTPLSTLGGPNGYASGINQRGQIVGWAETTINDPTCVLPQIRRFEAVLYGQDGTVTEFQPLPGDQDGAATAINNAGDAVGISGRCDNAVGALTARHAVIWHNGTVTQIKTFGGHGWNTPTDINNRGQVVGFADLSGDVVGGVLTFNPVAFVWTQSTGTQKILPLPGDTNSIAYAINDRGQVVGQSYGGPEGTRAFVWENGQTRDLNTLTSNPSLYLLYAEGINAAGQITGQACVTSGGSCTSETPAFFAAPAATTIGADAAAELSANNAPHATLSLDQLLRPLRNRGLAILISEPVAGN